MSSCHPSILYIYIPMSQKQEMATILTLTLWKINNPTSEKNSYFIITILIEMINILIEMIDNEMINIQERLINGQLVN